MNKTIDLSGSWTYSLDQENKGIKEAWFRNHISQDNTFQLPGTTTDNKVGTPLKDHWEFNEESVKSLRPLYDYKGIIWFQKTFKIPAEWNQKYIQLFLERVMFQSQVWINGYFAGIQDSLSVPHTFDVSSFIKPGEKNTFTIRVDNQDVQKIGTYPSAYTEETQTIWNGIIGKIELQCQERLRCSQIQVFPKVDQKNINVRMNLLNQTDKHTDITVSLKVKLADQKNQNRVDQVEERVSLPANGQSTFAHTVHLSQDLYLWDEFTPHLYELEVTLADDHKIKDLQTITFGMSEFKRNGTQFEVNGNKTFLRGTLECCIFPLTGYPPTDEDEWEGLFQIAKEYGLNHIRFHSWCPPEAAFNAADKLGVYIQVETPVWMDNWNIPVGSEMEHYTYLPAEAKRIIETYGNHPSFTMFAVGNELNGDFNLLHTMIKELKDLDDRQVYTLTSNWDRPLDPADDFFIAQTIDGIGARNQYFQDEMAHATTLDFTEAISKRDVPFISHEIGQYSVYPQVNKIDKYSGLLRAVNFEVIKNDLAQKSLFADVEKFVYGSGKLAVQLYRDEIEAALRTPGMGGFQLLDLHDFPGQSTATVGILDAFWDSKGLIEPHQFRQFCGPTVPLLRMPKRLYQNNEEFISTVELAHYGPKDLSDKKVCWEITDMNKNVYDSGEMLLENGESGRLIKVGTISASLQNITKAKKVNIALSIKDTSIKNSWEIWVYPSQKHFDERSDDENDLIITDVFNENVESSLEQGKNVLLLLHKDQLDTANPGKFYPVFWSPVHFSSEDPCGIYVNDKHPLFHEFPTDSYANYQWKELLEQSVSMDISGFDYEPIVQVIPNFFHNKKLANLLEFKVGHGKLLVCSIDLTNNLEERMAAKQLRKSILSYIRSDHFNPTTTISLDDFKMILNQNRATDQDYDFPGIELATGQKSQSDSEKSAEFSAGKGNDGLENTLWCAADHESGHWWQVDLGSVRKIYGTRIKFMAAANYLYVILFSNDGKEWNTAVNQTGNTLTDQVRLDKFNVSARYLRIVYNGIPAEVEAAGHYQFEVYGE